MFKIGEFSQLSRVSVRMLRHYDQLGLLKPSRTDTFTNYRYYSADQLPRLNRILALRDLGFSLEQIGNMLDEDLSAEQLTGMLKLKRAEIEQQMQVEQLRMARLEARISQMNGQTDPGQYDVVVREIEPQLVATYRELAPDDDRIQYMFEELEAYVTQFNARADKPPMSIYHDPEYREENIDAEVVVPLKSAIPGTDVFHVLEMARIPKAACVVHTGEYATIYQAYNALLRWIEANGYRMKGPIREVYLSYSADGLGFELPPTYLVKESNPFVTELQLEIEKD
ncbi:MAG TPA: MerR family transcriptional regulator [Anaerolineales bacterium]|nr:MerR family transcriptional regulator [Anaerolineales bacterium]